MVRRDLVVAKLSEVADRVARVRARCPETAEALGADRDAMEIVSFNLMLAVQACADVASHLVADERWPAATTLGASFERLRDHGVLGASTSAALGRAVGLRNVVAHGYAGVNPAMVHEAAVRGTADLEAFIHEVASWLDRSPTEPA